MKELKFLISKVKEAFKYLKQVFTKVLILGYFNAKYHIWIKTHTLTYIIGEVFS